ncbi:MAG: glycoside hydrolase family 2 TIM barrel-domain containing protein [Eubacteriales bacterium]|nr:glycoside hydrolase family 2 TIM barrel-domain containing protein [Eubacteriales bacterium]MDD3504084.1 glycoside hydrolase family 2 TIM barrel-domain containing protein [Eubacteriales bacterium]
MIKNVREQNIDRNWKFNYGIYNPWTHLRGSDDSLTVNLPHDYMISSDVSADAPSGPAMGYYNGQVGNYTKHLHIPAEWSGNKVFLHFDGVMMNSTIDVNGNLAGKQHYGYVPFQLDITPFVNFGEKNRVTVTVNPSMQPNSRWYTGAGIYRSVSLVCTPMIHITNGGIYTYTNRVEYENETAVRAHLTTEVTVANDLSDTHLVQTEVAIEPEQGTSEAIVRRAVIQVKAGSSAVIPIKLTVDDPRLWSDRNPEMYRVRVKVTDLGVFSNSLKPIATDEASVDEAQILTGIRTITVDSTDGLRINGQTVKLKGACIHHDNGMLGAVSLYDAEYRKIKIMKDNGFNAIRCAHNPASRDLLRACDRLGMYVMDEAFDAWGMGKQPGDYHQFFDSDWQSDLEKMITSHRNHPSIIMWSTGNEIVERGGLGDGYELALQLAEATRKLDRSRPVTNGLCSYWSGLDDQSNDDMVKQKYSTGLAESIEQNILIARDNTMWEERSEPFVSMLDVVGYNYAEERYALANEMFPERVIAGTESYPMAIAQIWPLVEKMPHVIGDFTWTGWDYIGEAGIGRVMYVDKNDPLLKAGPYALMTVPIEYPWRLADDADFDINGRMTPQGAYRKIVWGSKETHIFTADPGKNDQVEIVNKWGWPQLYDCYTWDVEEGHKVKAVVYSSAQEVALLLDGQLIEKKSVGENEAFTVVFNLPYKPGCLEAVSYTDGQEVSRACLKTTSEAKKIRVVAEADSMIADGHCLNYVNIELVDATGHAVYADKVLRASISGAAELIGFGSANPITDENYTSGVFSTYHGRAMAIVRSGYEAGEAVLKVSCEDLETVNVKISVFDGGN